MNRCVIVGGAPIDNINVIKSYIKDNDYIICCDCGLRHCAPLGITPNLIVGDFDSYDNPMVSTETIVLPCEKDDTDSFFAVKEAYKRGHTKHGSADSRYSGGSAGQVNRENLLGQRFCLS